MIQMTTEIEMETGKILYTSAKRNKIRGGIIGSDSSCVGSASIEAPHSESWNPPHLSAHRHTTAALGSCEAVGAVRRPYDSFRGKYLLIQKATEREVELSSYARDLKAERGPPSYAVEGCTLH